jgi:hypothetical protein
LLDAVITTRLFLAIAINSIADDKSIPSPPLNFGEIAPININMLIPCFRNRTGKVCALVAATLILPGLAFAGGGNGQGGNGQGGNGQGGNGQGGYSVPDRGPGILLVTATIGAVLLFGAIQRSRAKT